VAKKAFREDLYYRLSVMPLKIPSLSERREDIALLVERFSQNTYKQHGLPPLSLTPAALLAVENAEWPGNVRQLSHALQVAVIRASLAGASAVERRHLFPSVTNEPDDAPSGLSFQELTRRYQRQILTETLEATGWNISETARRLDLARSHVYNLIQAFELSR